MTSARSRGHELEQLAKRYLIYKGLTPIEDNFHCRMGEIDLIMRHGETVVFVEVRTRQDARFMAPEYSVHYPKQVKLTKTALLYMQRHPYTQSLPCRFDVVGITQEHKLRIAWIQNAFQVSS